MSICFFATASQITRFSETISCSWRVGFGLAFTLEEISDIPITVTKLAATLISLITDTKSKETYHILLTPPLYDFICVFTINVCYSTLVFFQNEELLTVCADFARQRTIIESEPLNGGITSRLRTIFLTYFRLIFVACSRLAGLSSSSDSFRRRE